MVAFGLGGRYFVDVKRGGRRFLRGCAGENGNLLPSVATIGEFGVLLCFVGFGFGEGSTRRAQRGGAATKLEGRPPVVVMVVFYEYLHDGSHSGSRRAGVFS